MLPYQTAVVVARDTDPFDTNDNDLIELIVAEARHDALRKYPEPRYAKRRSKSRLDAFVATLTDWPSESALIPSLRPPAIARWFLSPK